VCKADRVVEIDAVLVGTTVGETGVHFHEDILLWSGPPSKYPGDPAHALFEISQLFEMVFDHLLILYS
jgi:hypothetical protein